MKTKFGIVLILFFTLFLQGYTQINDSLYSKDFTFKKYNKFHLGGIYSNAIFENNSENMMAMVVFNDYLIKSSEHWAFGIGSGLKIYEKQIFIPFYIDLLSCIKKHLFIDAQSGYSFAWKRKSKYYPDYNFQGNLTGTFGVGYKLRFNSDFNSYLQLSYNYQRAILDSETKLSSSVNFHSIMLTFGLLLERK